MPGAKSKRVPRAVIDPNVLVSAAITPKGQTAALIPALERGAYELIISRQVLVELGGVLGRVKFRRYISEEDAEAFLAMTSENSEFWDDTPAGVALSEDPKDEYLITLARTARVDALVSGDPHLIRLKGSIPVMTPREFLESLPKEGEDA
jgi:putative PIN family toxin of toxin-antitoxin system